VKFRAKVLLFNSKTGKYVQPGEETDLSHLDEQTIDMLVKGGAIEPATEKKEKEVK